MRLRKLKNADYLALVANLIPVYGVWFLGWSAVQAFIVYSLETLLIGMITVLKLLVATIYKGRDTWYNQGQTSQVSGLFFIVFFIIHYGMFAAIQSTIFSSVAGIVPPGKGAMHFFFNFWEYIDVEVAYMLAAFLVSYLGRSFAPFIMNGEYRTTPMTILMFQPYGRIFIQQFTVIAGSMFLMFGFGKGFILIFAAVKIWADLMINYSSILDKAVAEMQEAQKPRP